MRRAIAVLTLAVLAAWPGRASAGNLDLKLGAFFPRAASGLPNDLFADDANLYIRDGNRLEKKDWVGPAGGIAYNSRLAPNFELGVGLDGYGKKLHTSYADYTDDAGAEIRQTLQLSVVPLGVSLRAVPTSRLARVAPFVEVGADLVFYEYKESGDFIDFEDPNQTIYSDAFKASGTTLGWHVAGGVRVPVSDDFSLVGQYRYQIAKKKDMGPDFGGLALDLNGGMATFGVNIRF
jgi:opacity protein-like surface antigen